MTFKRSALLCAALIWLPFASYADGDGHDYGCDRQSVDDFEFFEAGTAGRGQLCVMPRGLRGQLRLGGLIPGNAYTVWWTYLDDPSLCGGMTPLPEDMADQSDCDIFDFGAPPGGKPIGMFGRMASGVAPRNGRLNLRASLGGMQPSSGSEVWFWLFTHGPANYSDGAALGRQLLTPEDPVAGAPHLGNEADGQRGFPAGTVVFKIE